MQSHGPARRRSNSYPSRVHIQSAVPENLALSDRPWKRVACCRAVSDPRCRDLVFGVPPQPPAVAGCSPMLGKCTPQREVRQVQNPGPESALSSPQTASVRTCAPDVTPRQLGRMTGAIRQPHPVLRGHLAGPMSGHDIHLNSGQVHLGVPRATGTLIKALDEPLDVGWIGQRRSQHLWASMSHNTSSERSALVLCGYMTLQRGGHRSSSHAGDA